MPYLNEVNAETLTIWLSNFNNYTNNIFAPFSTNEIVISSAIYQAICNNNLYHVNLYFGLDEVSNPKAIVVGSYELDSYDSDQSGYVDVLGTNLIYELYSGLPISIATAQGYIGKWIGENGENPIFKKGALLPRPNFIKIFVEDGANSATIFFGLDSNNELKVMEKDPNGSDLVLNKSFPCPAFCGKQGLSTGL